MSRAALAAGVKLTGSPAGAGGAGGRLPELTTEEVCEWLCALGKAPLAPLFREACVDGAVGGCKERRCSEVSWWW